MNLRPWMAWLFLAVLLITTACLADTIGRGDRGSGFGRAEIALMALGIAIAVVALFDRKNYWLPRMMLAGASTYAVLLVAEFALWNMKARKVSPTIYMGMYTPDEKVGVRLTANWRGTCDDGWVSPEYQINSLGHRDDEPSPTHGSGILLLGDSFTFGIPLEDEYTIDKQIERLSGQQVNAYNTGVPGAGPPQILEYFRRCDWFDGGHVVYLCCYNDLFAMAQLSDFYTVVDRQLAFQYSLKTLERISREDIRKMRARVAATRAGETPVVPFLKLRQLQRTAANTMDYYALRFGWEAPESGNVQYDVKGAIRATEEMRKLADERSLTFHVVIIPSLNQVIARRYSEQVESYIAALKQRGVPCIELLPELTADSYCVHDAHFSESGTELTATSILSSLRENVVAVRPADYRSE